MNITSNRLLNGFNNIIKKAGNQVSIRWFYQTYDDVYDEPESLSISGTLWTSGMMFPVKGSDDAVLLEQGKISLGDSKIYLTGSINLASLTGSSMQVKIGIGSPGDAFYSLILPGTNQWMTEDNDIYKLAYIRKLPNGSLIGE